MCNYIETLRDIHNEKFGEYTSPLYTVKTTTVANKLNRCHSEILKAVDKIPEDFSQDFFETNYRRIISPKGAFFNMSIQGFYFLCGYLTDEGFDKKREVFTALSSNLAKQSISLYMHCHEKMMRHVQDSGLYA